ncbi:MAG: ATP-binding protein, partial [Planctomycetota bacterium]
MVDPLSESFASHRHVCEQLGAAVIAMDTTLRIRIWNAAASKLFGAEAPSMIGTSAVHVFPVTSRDTAERVLLQALDTGETMDFEFCQRDTHGQDRTFLVIVAAVRSDSGECVGVSMCIRDITQRIDLLEQVGRNKKMVALGQLAGAIAHYFNNILGGMITGVDYARERDDPAFTGKTLQSVSKGLTRASALVKGLSAFSQGDPGAEDLSDYTEILADLADEADRECHALGIHFTFHAPQLPALPVPRSPVRTILRNILQNAVEATPKGGEVTMDVTLSDEWMETRVTDTGCGLDEEAKSRLFEPLWSTKGGLESGTADVKGLGLAIAYGLAKFLGGTIEANSEVGKGSCFAVRL